MDCASRIVKNLGPVQGTEVWSDNNGRLEIRLNRTASQIVSKLLNYVETQKKY